MEAVEINYQDHQTEILMVDIRQSFQYADHLSHIGWTVERKNGINYFIKKLPLIGGILKIQRPEKIDFEAIKEIKRKHNIFQVVIEPTSTTVKNPAIYHNQYNTTTKKRVLTSRNGTSHINKLYTHGFKLSKSPYLPTKTLQIDLTHSPKKLLNKMKKDAGYAINKNPTIKINSTSDIERFRKAWRRATGIKRYVPTVSHLSALKKSFGKNALFLLTDDNSSGAIFLSADKVVYYWQAFTNNEGRKKQLQYKIVWEGILWAKKCGAKIFDFEGIYDERFPNRSWLGFTHFKKSFGGEEIDYPGCFIKTVLLSRK